MVSFSRFGENVVINRRRDDVLLSSRAQSLIAAQIVKALW